MQLISSQRAQHRPTFLLIYLLSSSLSSASELPNTPGPTNSSLDPKDDPNNPLGYIASNTLAGVAFSLVLAVAITQTLNLLKWGAWWMMCMNIGAYTLALGLACRFGLHVKPDSRRTYIAESFFVILSPCAFIAADYVLLGRLARYLGSGKHLLVPPSRITITFVISDITTFLIQATGGAVSVVASTTNGEQLGSHIFLGALIIQLISFLIFTLIFSRFVYRVHKFEHEAWLLHRENRWYNDWRMLGVALGVSCVGIIIRSFYRVVELSQGFFGPIAQNEGLFYALDTLPLLIAIFVYVPFWPGRFIQREPAIVTRDTIGAVPEFKKKEDHVVTERAYCVATV